MNLQSVIRQLQEASEREHKFTTAQARAVGNKLGVDWNHVDIEQFRMGLESESEHAEGSPLGVVRTDVGIAKIALRHLVELPSYYTKLKKVEKDKPEHEIEVLKKR